MGGPEGMGDTKARVTHPTPCPRQALTAHLPVSWW
jgi:hypothetical protein